MMLAIQILDSSKPQEKILELLNAEYPQKVPAVLREDDVLLFTTSLDEEYLNLTLVLHENEIAYTNRFSEKGRWVYEWRPKKTWWGNEAFFHNYYGVAELSIMAKNPNDSEEIIFLKNFNPIDVLAKKITADRIASMLDFLARQDGKDLAGAIRITRIKAGYKDGGRTADFLLERIENNLIFLKKILPVIVSRPIVKLEQITRLVTPNQETLIDEMSLGWVVENPDILYQVHSIDESIISYDGEYFSANKIIESQTEASFDVYENQVVHGFIATLIFATKDIQKKLTRYTNTPQISTQGFDGYISFFTQILKFSSMINKNKVDHCLRLISELNRISAWLKQKLPVKKHIFGIPSFTQKAKYNLLYQQVFNRMISWHRHGAPDWSFQDELNSIKDIPKLFEYYLLCIVKYHLGNMGTPEVPTIESNLNAQSDVFEYKWGANKIRLKYEPEIWTVEHARSSLNGLVNTEGWTNNKNRNSIGKEFKFDNKNITPRKSKGSNSKRCPDLMIEVCCENKVPQYLIIDAKYTDSEKAFITELPRLTMKYLHGIHQSESGSCLSVALMIVNPNEVAETRHFHHKDFSIYGRLPVTPALMVTSIDVSKAHEDSSNIRNDIYKVIQLIVNKNC